MRPQLHKAFNQAETNLDELFNKTTSFRLWAKATEYGANRALEKCGKLSLWMTKKECYEAYNQPAVDRALKMKPCPFRTSKKGGKTSNVMIFRPDFELWSFEDELLSEPIGK